jgi:HPt (histidine-containing phosphotransfer) domain-containing protein
MPSHTDNLSRIEKTGKELNPPVDLERFHDALGDDPDEIAEILDIYCNQMAESLVKLATAIADNNASEIELIAHNCAGTSSNCGMVAVVEQLRELERMGRENQLKGAAYSREQVAFEFERIKLFLSERFAPVAAH